MKRQGFLVGILFLGAGLLQAQEEKTFFLISNSHLDTQWNWDVRTTISQYVQHTLTDNMALMDKYPSFRLNYEGAIKYMWMKEYYPEDFERLKHYVASGQWHVSGMSVDASDVMMSSAESILHSMLYANRFYRQEFGVRGGHDVMLPDCFGFSYALPSLMRHAGQRGFHTAKLGWGAASYSKLPNFGVWQGVDGSQVYAIYKPGAYDTHESWNKDLTGDAGILSEIQANTNESGLPVAVKYVGPRSDHGGALQDNPDKEGENTPYWLCYNAEKNDGSLKVRLATPDEFFQYMEEHDEGQYKVWNSELPMRTHGVGAYTSWGALKLWNRKNELLADAAEKASSVATWLGLRSYPSQQLRDAWVRQLWQQHHDGLPGTSILSANEYSYNESYLAHKAFAGELRTSAGAVVQAMDTQTEGTPIVVFNPLSHERTDIVEGSIPCDVNHKAIRVFGPDGNEVLAQPTRYDLVARRLHFIFAATVPSLGFAVFEARIGEVCSLTSDLAFEQSGNLRKMNNGRFRVTVNSNGDISNLYDLQNSKTLISTPVRQQLIYDHEDTWPAWEISYTDVCRTPSSFVSKNMEAELVEDGPLRKSLKITRRQEGSTFVQYIRMNALNDRIECLNEVDWQTPERMLKVNFPFNFANSTDTYDISLGTISRGVRTSDEYEVCGHQWADHSLPSGAYGVSILSDCKYGWDKPNDKSLRLTLLHTPSCKNYSHQANMDIGPNRFTYALLPHEGGWSQHTQMQASQLNQPLIAFVAPRHNGALGRRQPFAALSTDKVSIKALKKAEDTDELIVRVYEWAGEDQHDVRLSFPAPIVSAREVNGIEEELASSDDIHVGDSSIVFSIGHYQPKTFAVRLQALTLQPSSGGDLGQGSDGDDLPQKGTEGAFESVTLPFNIDLMSFDDARGNATTAYTYAYPAELIPDTLVCDGIGFVMGPREHNAKNVLRLTSSQTIALDRKQGHNKLYLLLASPSEAGSEVKVAAGGEETILSVPYFSGRVCEPLSCTSVGENYRPQDVALACSHAHKVSDKSNQVMQMLYIYKYGIELPEGVEEVTLSSSDRRTFLFAATTAANQTDDIVDFAPLTPFRGNEMVNGKSSNGKWDDGRLVPRTATASHQTGTSESGSKANDGDPTTKWCATSSQSQTPYLQYIMKDTVVIDRWMVLGAARESGDYVAKSFKLQYLSDDGSWVDADIVTDNQLNKVVRTLKNPVTTTRVRLQMVQGEQNAYTTRIYEFAVYGYLKSEDPTSIEEIKNEELRMKNGEDAVYDLGGRKWLDGKLPRGIFIKDGRKEVIKE